MSMLILLSPAKRIDSGKGSANIPEGTVPEYIKEANKVASLMKQYSPRQLETRLKIKPQLALTAASYFAAWQNKPLEASVIPALLAYNGDVYRGLSAPTLSRKAWLYAQKHLRILTAMYGILRPTDNIQFYRLEMATEIKPNGTTNLYEYWQEKIEDHIRLLLKKTSSQVIINLASEEYFKAVDPSRLNVRVIQPVFKEFRAGEYKSLFMYIKFARGRMARFIMENNLNNPEELKAFDWEGYGFDPNLSQENKWVFTRQS